MRKRSNRGAHAVEFALVLPILLAIVLGSMDYGWYFATRSSLVQATAVAARAGAVAAAGTEEATAEAAAATAWASLGWGGSPTFDAQLLVMGGVNVVEVTGSMTYASLVNGYVPVPPSVVASTARRVE